MGYPLFRLTIQVLSGMHNQLVHHLHHLHFFSGLSVAACPRNRQRTLNTASPQPRVWNPWADQLLPNPAEIPCSKISQIKFLWENETLQALLEVMQWCQSKFLLPRPCRSCCPRTRINHGGSIGNYQTKYQRLVRKRRRCQKIPKGFIQNLTGVFMGRTNSARVMKNTPNPSHYTGWLIGSGMSD